MMASLRDAETSAARFGMMRLKCELRTQRAHFESFFGGNVGNAIHYGREALRMAKAAGTASCWRQHAFALGQAHWMAGEYRSAIDELGADAPDYLEGLRVSRFASTGTLAVDGLAILGGCLRPSGGASRKHSTMVRRPRPSPRRPGSRST